MQTPILIIIDMATVKNNVKCKELHGVIGGVLHCTNSWCFIPLKVTLLHLALVTLKVLCLGWQNMNFLGLIV